MHIFGVTASWAYLSIPIMCSLGTYNEMIPAHRSSLAISRSCTDFPSVAPSSASQWAGWDHCDSFGLAIEKVLL